jgi:putative endonuclease
LAEHIELGKRGEQIAESFLELKGYRILERNWRHRRTEIDIIAEIEGKLIFVEVKTRSSNDFSNPEEAVTLKKQDSIARAAGAYILKVNHEWLIRYDVIAIVLQADDTYQIQHFEDAFF